MQASPKDRARPPRSARRATPERVSWRAPPSTSGPVCGDAVDALVAQLPRPVRVVHRPGHDGVRPPRAARRVRGGPGLCDAPTRPRSGNRSPPATWRTSSACFRVRHVAKPACRNGQQVLEIAGADDEARPVGQGVGESAHEPPAAVGPRLLGVEQHPAVRRDAVEGVGQRRVEGRAVAAARKPPVVAAGRARASSARA